MFKKKIPLKNVQGIVFKNKGKIVENSDRPLEDVNNFPMPAYHLVDIEKYVSSEGDSSRTLRYSSGYSYIHKWPEYKKSKGKWTCLNVKRVVDELELLAKKYNIDRISFVDRDFFLDKERVEKMCKEIIKRKLNIKLRVGGRTNELLRYDESLWKLLEKSGFSEVVVYVQPSFLIDKDTTIEKIIELTKLCKRYNIKLFYSFTVGFSKASKPNIPIDEEFDQILNLIRRIYSITKNCNILCLYVPYPGTPLYEISTKNRFKEPKSLEEWSRVPYLEKVTPGVPTKYVNILKQLNNFIFPFASNEYLKYRDTRNIEKLGWIGKYSKLFHKLFWFVALLFHYTALFRLKYKFWSFPIEYKMINFVLRKERV